MFYLLALFSQYIDVIDPIAEITIMKSPMWFPPIIKIVPNTKLIAQNNENPNAKVFIISKF